MFCPNCGTQYEGNSCPNCGASFSAPQNFSDTPMKKPKKKRKVFLGVLGAMVLILIISSMFSSTPSNSNGVAPPVTDGEPVTSNTAPSSSDTTANAYTFFQAFEDNESIPYLITPNAKQFLLDHPELFPAATSGDPDGFTDYTLEYKHLAKNVSKYGDQLMYLTVRVVQIDEYTITDEVTVSLLNVIDWSGNQYYIFYKGTLDAIFENDSIEVYALPLDMSSFSNTDGGQTLAPVLAGSYVAKVAE